MSSTTELSSVATAGIRIWPNHGLTVLMPSPTRDESWHWTSFVLVAQPVALAVVVVVVVLGGLVVVAVVLIGLVVVVLVVVVLIGFVVVVLGAAAADQSRCGPGKGRSQKSYPS